MSDPVVSENVWDRIAEEYHAVRTILMRANSRDVEWVRQQSALCEHRQLAIDVGGGTGALTSVLSEQFGRTISIDGSQRMIDWAIYSAPVTGTTEYIVTPDWAGTLKRVCRQHGRADVVLSSYTLHHLLPIRPSLMTLADAVRPNGQLLLIDVVVPTEAWRVQRFHRRRADRLAAEVTLALGDKQLGDRVRALFTSQEWLTHVVSNLAISPREHNVLLGMLPGAEVIQPAPDVRYLRWTRPQWWSKA